MYANSIYLLYVKDKSIFALSRRLHLMQFGCARLNNVGHDSFTTTVENVTVIYITRKTDRAGGKEISF